MLLLKYLLMTIGWGLLAFAAAIALNNLNKVVQYHRRARIHIAPEPGSLPRTSRGEAEDNPPVKPQLNWTTAQWAVLGAWLPLILAKGIAVVPSGMGGVRVSQTSGTRPGTSTCVASLTQVSAGNPNGTCLRRGRPVPAERIVPCPERSEETSDEQSALSSQHSAKVKTIPRINTDERGLA